MNINYYSRRRLRYMAAQTVGDRLLDVGCAAMPNPYLRGRRVVGFDRNPMDVRPPYTEHVVGDIPALDRLLSDQVFDAVLLGEFIEHVEQPFDVLRLLLAHVAPGGRLILSTPNVIGFPVVVAEYLWLRRFYYTEEHVFCFSPRWVWRLLERSGYRVLKTKGCGLCGPWGWWFPAPRPLCYHIVYVAAPA